MNKRSIPAWLCVAIIFFFSSREGNAVSLPSFANADKVAHFTAFFILGWMIAFSFRSNLWQRFSWRLALLCLLLASIYGIVDEYHQSFVPGREVSAMDWLADFLGALTAIALIFQTKIWKRFG